MKHVIIGAGPAGVTAAEEIRRRDPGAEIHLISDEPEPPYSRMAIPYLIKGQVDEQGTHFRVSDTHFDDLRITLNNAEVERLDTGAKTVVLSDGQQINFDKLLIATGGTPITPPIEGIDLPGVHPCWTLENARQIIRHAVPDSHIVLIGAGFISTTIVEALVERGGALTIIEMEDRLIPRMMDMKGAQIIRNWCEAKGVDILTSTRVDKIEMRDGKLLVNLPGADPLEANLVISATGVKPNIDFLRGSDIELRQGVLVDEFLASNHPDIFAAGDVAEAPDFITGKRSVMAIQPIAVEQGRLAGINMVKANTVNWRGSINMNVLDLLGLISCSFGLWEGTAENGESAELYQPDQNRYLKLQFESDHLIGASSVGYSDHIGVLQGLIQGRVALGEWKDRLMAEPDRLMEAWIGSTQGVA